MDLQLQGKVALITGGSRGIGKAIAEKFLDEGVRVAIAARDQNRLADTVTKLDEKYTGQISGYICDTRDLSSIQQMVSEITNRWGDINILVNNAAIRDPRVIKTAEGLAARGFWVKIFWI